VGVAAAFLSGQSYDLWPGLPQLKQVTVKPPAVGLAVLGGARV
jgi:hypothetical protein